METLCPHCLSCAVPRPAQAQAGVVACADCKNLFSPQPDGGAALLLPDHVVVSAVRGRFAIAVRSFFVTFGHAGCDLSFQLDRDNFTWSEPPLLGPLRLRNGTCSTPRETLARFAWLRFGHRSETGEHEVVSDLVIVARDRSEQRAGFGFPARFPAGPSIATALQWAHETWFGDASGYRRAGTDVERPNLSILRRDGTLQALIKTGA
jgi:hypothetical protein